MAQPSPEDCIPGAHFVPVGASPDVFGSCLVVSKAPQTEVTDAHQVTTYSTEWVIDSSKAFSE